MLLAPAFAGYVGCVWGRARAERSKLPASLGTFEVERDRTMKDFRLLGYEQILAERHMPRRSVGLFLISSRLGSGGEDGGSKYAKSTRFERRALPRDTWWFF